MLSNLLVSVPWLAFAVLVAVIVLAPVAGVVLAVRPRTTATLFIISVVAIAGLTLYPESGSSPGPGCVVKLPYLAPTAVESTANILLFVPVAFLAGLRWRRPALAILGASALSAVIELIQSGVLAIGRACDTGDWITNSIGAVLGGLLSATALAWHRHRTPPERRARSGRG